MALMSVTMLAQGDVTTFLGIPVDGTESEMRQKLISKGFVPKTVGRDEFLAGEFNGTQVLVSIITNHNRVWRIALLDEYGQDEANIKIRFNRLVNQFENNERYMAAGNYTLSDDEKISYEMLVNNKIYQAVFYQDLDVEKMDSSAVQEKIRNGLLGKFTEEELQQPSEEVKEVLRNILLDMIQNKLSTKPVSFRIVKDVVRYKILMCYDNVLNQAHGEDL